MSRSVAPPEQSVRIDGDDVDGESSIFVDLDEWPTTTERITVACASGTRGTAEWRGVPLAPLIEETAPPDTTHLRIHAGDGHTVCLPVADALDGLLAVERDGVPLAATEEYAVRFLAPEIDGSRTVKGVDRIDPLSLPAGADRESYESLGLDDSAFRKGQTGDGLTGDDQTEDDQTEDVQTGEEG